MRKNDTVYLIIIAALAGFFSFYFIGSKGTATFTHDSLDSIKFNNLQKAVLDGQRKIAEQEGAHTDSVLKSRAQIIQRIENKYITVVQQTTFFAPDSAAEFLHSFAKE